MERPHHGATTPVAHEGAGFLGGCIPLARGRGAVANRLVDPGRKRSLGFGHEITSVSGRTSSRPLTYMTGAHDDLEPGLQTHDGVTDARQGVNAAGSCVGVDAGNPGGILTREPGPG